MKRTNFHRIGALSATLALAACVGCGGQHDGGSTAADAATPPVRATRSPAGAGFTATAGRTAVGTATSTRSGPAAATPTPTPPLTPVAGTETVTPTVSVSPTRTRPAVSHAVLRIGSVRGESGAIVSVDAILEVEEGVNIAGVENDLAFDRNALTLVENADGGPACAVNPEIVKEHTAFAFQPPGCEVDGSCTGVRALVVSFANVDPIPSGARLYSCDVAISASAEIGAVYALPCSSTDASDPDGNPINIECQDGEISVGGEVPPTATPTPTPTPTCALAGPSPTCPPGELICFDQPCGEYCFCVPPTPTPRAG